MGRGGAQGWARSTAVGWMGWGGPAPPRSVCLETVAMHCSPNSWALTSGGASWGGTGWGGGAPMLHPPPHGEVMGMGGQDGAQRCWGAVGPTGGDEAEPPIPPPPAVGYGKLLWGGSWVPIRSGGGDIQCAGPPPSGALCSMGTAKSDPAVGLSGGAAFGGAAVKAERWFRGVRGGASGTPPAPLTTTRSAGSPAVRPA